MSDSDLDEDYMSSSFIQPSTTTTNHLVPLHSLPYSQRRKLASSSSTAITPSPSLSEKHAASLKRKLDQSNVGMKLLKQMGYKEGSGLGKSGTGITEPVLVQLRTNREGIGIQTQREILVDQEIKRVRLLQQHEGQFRIRSTTKFTDKQIEQDVRQARNICYQLDSEVDVLDYSHFWPLVVQPPPPPPPLSSSPSHHSVSMNNNPDEINLSFLHSDDDTVSSSAYQPVQPLTFDHDNDLDSNSLIDVTITERNNDANEPCTENAKLFEALLVRMNLD